MRTSHEKNVVPRKFDVEFIVFDQFSELNIIEDN